VWFPWLVVVIGRDDDKDCIIRIHGSSIAAIDIDINSRVEQCDVLTGQWLYLGRAWEDHGDLTIWMQRLVTYM
jgi:hypothetical protein